MMKQALRDCIIYSGQGHEAEPAFELESENMNLVVRIQEKGSLLFLFFRFTKTVFTIIFL